MGPTLATAISALVGGGGQPEGTQVTAGKTELTVGVVKEEAKLVVGHLHAGEAG